MRYRSLLANPKSYDIERAVATLEVDPWTVGNRDLKKGDRLLVWKAKGNDETRGIIALGVAVSEPYERDPAMQPDFDLWLEPRTSGHPIRFVDVQYLSSAKLPMWYTTERRDLLDGLTVTRAQGGPVFYEDEEPFLAVVEALGGWPTALPPISTSELLKVGSVYARKELAERFGIVDQTINTGIFQPKGHRPVWLFVPEDKLSDRRQYVDTLEGTTIYWQGQNSGRKDDLIINHEASDLELLLFYRKQKQEFDNYGFRYHGRFKYLCHQPNKDGPTDFTLVAEHTSAPSSEASTPPEAESEVPFDPTQVEQGREYVHGRLAHRPGQSAFRQKLLNAYNGRCAVTGCEVEAVLEASHIYPYQGSDTDHISNGLLLRSDIHLLFDQGLLAIHPKTLKAMIAPDLSDSEYGSLDGKDLLKPKHQHQCPSTAALIARLEQSPYFPQS